MKRILIVEDDVTVCLSLSDLLNEFGFETGVADNGYKALEILESCDPLPDFILLDLHMPQMDGWQLQAALKSNEKYCDIPVIVMTGDSNSFQEADLTKPIDIHQLFARITQ